MPTCIFAFINLFDAHFLCSYDHPHILAGQGTMGLEMLEQVNDLDAVVIPVGGGGMIAGVALAVKSLNPNVLVIVSMGTQLCSEGQEKYLRELSITPVGAVNHSRGVLHESYKKSLPCGVPQELFCMVKMRYFRGTGMIFPRLASH
jgi:1-aminocyclopropane-1-carboxylate deaminase/D-cysteine desulfhydrase-like pyridoxal-dependent ACC family enzyme